MEGALGVRVLNNPVTSQMYGAEKNTTFPASDQAPEKSQVEFTAGVGDALFQP